MTTIAQERLRLANVGLVIRRRPQWGSVFDYTTARSVTEPADAAFNHISVTNPSSYSSNDAHMRAIERIGISRFPNTGISYNGAVLPGGVLYEGQPWGRRGAHTVNDFRRSTCSTTGCPGRGTSLAAPSWNNNINGRALVFARNLDDRVTDADVEAAARYWAAYKLAGLLRANARLHGHRCVSAKSCPGNLVWQRIDDIADLTATYVRNGIPGTEPEPIPEPEPPRKAALMFVTRYGSSQYRLVTGDRMVGISESTYEKLKAAGVPATALDNTEVASLQDQLVAEDLPLEEAPSVP